MQGDAVPQGTPVKPSQAKTNAPATPKPKATDPSAPATPGLSQSGQPTPGAKAAAKAPKVKQAIPPKAQSSAEPPPATTSPPKVKTPQEPPTKQAPAKALAKQLDTAPAKAKAQHVDSAPAKVMAKPAAQAPAKALVKQAEQVPPKAKVQQGEQVPAKAMAKPAAQAPAKALVKQAEQVPPKAKAQQGDQAPAKAMAKPPAQAPAKALVKQAEQVPPKAKAQQGDQAPAKAMAKPPAQAPAKALVKQAEQVPRKAKAQQGDQAPAKAMAKPPAQAPAKALVKQAEQVPPKAKVQQGDQAPAKAMAKPAAEAPPNVPTEQADQAPPEEVIQQAPSSAAATSHQQPKAISSRRPSQEERQLEEAAVRQGDLPDSSAPLPAAELSDYAKQVAVQIDRDLPRTFPRVPAVDRERERIRRVLLAYSRANPHIGYCQGMSFPAAVLCVNLSDPMADARFQSCLEKVRELWLPGFHIFETAKQAFDVLLTFQSEALAESFQTQDVILNAFLLDAWLTLFARWLPFGMLLGVLDFVELRGLAGILCLSVAVVDSHGQSILGAPDPLVELWKSLQWDESQPNLETLLKVAEGMIPKANELLAEQCTVSRPITDVMLLAFERRGPQIVHIDTGADILDLLSEESWDRWKAQAQKFRKAPEGEKDSKDSRPSKSFLSFFRCGRSRADSDEIEPPKSRGGTLDKE